MNTKSARIGQAIKGTFIACFIICLLGCASMDKAEKGGLGGAAMGALLGQAIGGNTAGTLIGAGVGAGLGYIVGNEMDKKDAQKRQATIEDCGPLANTVWQVVSVTPKPKRPFASKVGKFNPDGTVSVTTVYEDGRTETHVERYRVVGHTLIINQDNYVLNWRFSIQGNQMYIDTGEYSVALQRI